MSLATLYRPAGSWLHRMPTGPKLFALLVAVTAVLLTTVPWAIGAELLATALLHPATRTPPRILLAHTRALLPFLVLAAGFQWLSAGWERAVVVGGQLLGTVLLAGLVTVCTRVSEMLALFEKLARPLERVGADARRIALVLALTVRCVPLVATAWRASADVCRARGMRRSWRLVVPLLVRLIRSAESLGDALQARGLDS